MDSKVFMTKLEHDSWPYLARDNKTVIRPFNESLMHTNCEFDCVFGDMKHSYCLYDEMQKTPGSNK